MIKVKWQEDGREDQPEKYTSRWDDNKGRLSAFLGGWTDWAKNNRHRSDKLHWRTTGALYASTFGSREEAARIPETVRCELYHVALMAYVNSQRCAHWADSEREEAFRLSMEEIVRRGGSILE